METLSYSSTFVRSLIKIVCVSFLACLFSCQQVTVVPGVDLVHITTTETLTVNSAATADSINSQPHIDPQPKKLDQLSF